MSRVCSETGHHSGLTHPLPYKITIAHGTIGNDALSINDGQAETDCGLGCNREGLLWRSCCRVCWCETYTRLFA